MKKQNNSIFILVTILVVAAFSIGMFMPLSNMGTVTMENMEEHRGTFLSYRDNMVAEMIESGEYKCCLVNPCTYCIEKTPGHGEGATCDCLTDVVEGRHPCGECIGEILEGHGNPYLAQYFAEAIAEEVGEQHLGTLQMIISEKYGL